MRRKIPLIYFAFFVSVVIGAGAIAFVAEDGSRWIGLATETFGGGLIGLMILAYENWRLGARQATDVRFKLADDLARIAALELSVSVPRLLDNVKVATRTGKIREYLSPVQGQIQATRFLVARLNEPDMLPVLKLFIKNMDTLTERLLELENLRASDRGRFTTELERVSPNSDELFEKLRRNLNGLTQLAVKLADSEMGIRGSWRRLQLSRP